MVEKYSDGFNGCKIFYDFKKGEKEKPCMVFLHGWTQNHTAWKKQIKFFNKQGYSTLAIDLRGHGKSCKPKKISDLGMKRISKDIKNILRKEKIKKYILVGHSFGGMVALEHYSLFPKDVKALILLGTPFGNPLKSDSYLKFFSLENYANDIIRFLKGVFHKNNGYIDYSELKPQNDISYFLKGVSSTPINSLIGSFRGMIKFAEKNIFEQIKSPTLIIAGEHDKRTSVKYLEDISNKIENSVLKIIKGKNAAHDINLQRPKKVEKIILDFLKKVGL